MAIFDSTARKPAPPEPAFRTPPHNIEAEQALLGAILVNNEAFYRVSDFLEPKHFLEPIHQRIFELTGGLIRAGKLATPVTLKTFLPGELDVAGLTVNQYLARLAAEATTIINAEDYGRTVYDLSIRRDLIMIGEDMVNLAYEAPVDATPQSHIEDAERKLFELAETGRYESGFQRFAQALTTAVDMAAQAYQRDGSLSGIATGLSDLDGKMGGLQNSDLIILAGRPGMGKTALATNIAYNVAKAYAPGEVRPDGRTPTANGGIVGFFSLEMSAEQLATRIIAEQTGIPSNKIRRGSIDEADFEKIKDISVELQNLPFYVDETGGLSIGQLVARARRLKRQRGLDLLVIDYIQLLQGTSRRSSENRVQEITEITTRLKALAKELNVPIVALSQLSRQVESRDDKRPQLSDLRESGSIEQDADVVMFVFREEYYHQMRKPNEGNREKFAEWLAEGERVEGKAEVIIGKQRHGPTGTVELQFDAAVTRFANLVASHQSSF
jgi:replicative DNA helicase